MTEIVHLYGTSENRDTDLYPDANTYVLNLTQTIKDIKKVELVHLAVPNTITNVSNIQEGTIFFSNISAVPGDPLTEYHIPNGFYSSCGLATEITNAVHLTSNITVSYLKDEGKFLFSRPTLDGSFSMQVQNEQLRRLLGITTGDVLDSTSVPDNTSLNIPLYSNNSRYKDDDFLKSNVVANPTAPDGIFLDIEELRTNFNIDAKKVLAPSGTYSSENINKVFGFIPLDVSSGDIKTFNKDYEYIIDYPYPIRKLDKLTITWYNKDGRIINFNGFNDNSFILKFYTTRENFPLIGPTDTKLPEPIAIPELEYGNRLDSKQKTIIVVSILALVVGLIILSAIRLQRK